MRWTAQHIQKTTRYVRFPPKPEISASVRLRPNVDIRASLALSRIMNENEHTLITRLLHGSVYWFQAFRKLVWYFTKPDTAGVHAIPLTADGKVVLVLLSYARGWRLPGGGKKKGEDCETAVVRELQEEIGLTTYDSIAHVSGFKHNPDYRRATGSLFVVRGVHYRPKWSLEVKQVGEFSLEKLPAATATITHRLLALAASTLRNATDPGSSVR